MAKTIIDAQQLENSLGLVTKYVSQEFLDSCAKLASAYKNAEDNEVNNKALENWRTVQSSYNELREHAISFMNETKNMFEIDEFLRTRFNPGEVKRTSLQGASTKIDMGGFTRARRSGKDKSLTVDIDRGAVKYHGIKMRQLLGYGAIQTNVLKISAGK